jgi:hypothetical protein
LYLFRNISLEAYRYSGTASLPKEVYQDTSQNISLILDRQSLIQGLHCETFTLEDGVAGEQVTLDIQEKDDREQFLEVQLLAAGFSTKGEEKQRQWERQNSEEDLAWRSPVGYAWGETPI